jgi:hypothetical protein
MTATSTEAVSPRRGSRPAARRQQLHLTSRDLGRGDGGTPRVDEVLVFLDGQRDRLSHGGTSACGNSTCRCARA